MYSKIMTIAVFISCIWWIIYGLLWNFWTGFAYKNTLVLYLNAISFLLVIIWFIFIALSLNRTVTKKVMQTFEFQYKILNYIRWWICNSIQTKQVHTPTDEGIFLVICVYCLLDALQMPLWVKSSILVIGSIFFTFLAVYFTFFVNNDLQRFHVGDLEMTLDLTSWIASSIRILAIFAWKQTFISIFFSQKSASIKRDVKIVWTQLRNIINKMFHQHLHKYNLVPIAKRFKYSN